jgi:polysaccharide chain length determinant protein (PEP-CTERM system associated)
MSDGLSRFLNVTQSAWRFRWAGLVTAWVVALLGWALVFSLPGRYDTQARVFLDMSSSLRPLLEGLAVPSNTGSQVEIVRRALIGRPQLEKVIASTGLSQRARSTAEHEALVSQLSKKIRIIGDIQSRNYSIAYSDVDPQVSYGVVKSLLDAFVSQSVQANRSDAQSAQKFLTDQIQEYERRLTESEKQLADFKSQHLGAMPDDRGGYFERLQAEVTEMDRLGASLSVAQRRRDELRQRLLGGNKVGDPGSRIETSVDARITETRRQLDDLLLNFTEAHPDVIALKEVLNNLESQRRREIESLRNNLDTLGTSRSSSGSLVQQNLQIALNETEVEIASLRAQMADRRQRVDVLRASINTLPQVEAELARLNRDYGSNRAQYDALLRRLESARLSEQAEQSQDVIFNIVEPPVMPVVPAAPNRVLLSFAVLAAAFGVGGAVAYLISVMRPVYLGLEELYANYEDVPVLGSIGTIRDRAQVFKARVDALLYYSGVTALVVLFAIVLVVYQRWGTLNVFALGGAA